MSDAQSNSRLMLRSMTYEFCLFPKDQTGSHFLPLREPWSYAEFHIKNTYSDTVQRTALAFISQAKSFSVAAQAASKDAAPLLWYYCFLNLSKALLSTVHSQKDIDSAVHGISDPADNAKGYMALSKQKIRTHSMPKRFSVFSNLCAYFGANHLTASGIDLSVKDMIGQIPSIHRAFMIAFGKTSSFIKMRVPEFLELKGTPHTGEFWLEFELQKEDFGNLSCKQTELLAGFGQYFSTIASSGESDICRVTSRRYKYAARNKATLIAGMQAELRKMVTTIVLPDGYLYYLMSPKDHSMVVPSPISIYAVMFYLGSIVRYRPYAFDKLVEKKHTWVIDEFMQICPRQFIIMIINELTQSEISYFDG
jgi:YaaC-like Protein